MASEIKVDTISEKTSAGGVTIDGLLIKDGNISGDVALAGTTPTFTIGDAGAEDAALVFDGNAKDFYIALDDSADKLVIGEGSTVGTNSILTITDDTVTIGDAAAVDTAIVFDGNAQDYYIALDDSADDLLIGKGSTVGTTPAISIDSDLKVNIPVTTASTSASTGSLITGGGMGVGADLYVGDDTYLITDSAVLGFGADKDTTLTHTDGTGLTLNSTNKLCFNDASQFIQGSSATVLSIGATDEIDLTATAVDLNGTLNVSGVATFQATPVFPDGSLALADLDIDGATDIGAAIVDADLFIVDDGAGGTNRKVTASRLKTYAGFDADAAQVFNESGNDVDFRVESSGSANMFIVDAGGDRVNINKAAGAGNGELNISGSHTTTHSSGELTSAEAGSGTIIELYNSSATDNNYSGIVMRDAGGFANGAIMCINTDHDAAGGGDLTFFTRPLASGNDNQQERMRIRSTGQVLITTASTIDANAWLQIKSVEAGYECIAAQVHTDGNQIARWNNSSGTEVGTITANSSSTDYNTSSDYRLKENETAITDGITRIKQLKPYRFNFKTDTNTTLDGFFAHEVSGIVPEAIEGDKDGMRPEEWYSSEDVLPEGKSIGDVKKYSETKIKPQGIDHSKLVPLLTAAIIELEARVKTLEG